MTEELFHIADGDLVKIAIAILCGGILGIERQYKNKTAGFRTIILITLGSTIFTLIAAQAKLGVNINVITGIGFIGAGVIFKDNVAVTGLTTAAVIWTSAAIGMAIGAGDYTLAILTSVVTVSVLTLFQLLEDHLDKLHRDKLLSITFIDKDYEKLVALIDIIKFHHLKAKVVKVSMQNASLEAAIMITGHRKNIHKLERELLKMNDIKGF